MTAPILRPDRQSTSPLQHLLETMQFRLAVKEGVAATLALFLGVGFSQAFDRPDSLVSGLWTVVTAIVVIQAYLGTTYQAAWVRFLGTLVGCFMGGLFTVLLGANALSLGISVFSTIVICSLCKLKDSVRIAALSVAIVMILWGLKPDISPWSFSIFRFLDSCLGIVVAVVVMHTLWPTQATRKVRLNIVLTLDKLNVFFIKAVDGSGTSFNDVKEIEEMVGQCYEFLEQSRIEIRTRSSVEDWCFLIEHLEELLETIADIQSLDKQTIKEMASGPLMECTIKTTTLLSSHINYVADCLYQRLPAEGKQTLMEQMDELDAALKAHRATHVSQKYPLGAVESFFVFYYSLRRLAGELCKMEERLSVLY